MNKHVHIQYTLLLGILLFCTSTEVVLAENVKTPIEEVPATAESPQTEGGSFLDKLDSEETSAEQTFFPKLTKVLQSVAIVILLVVGTVIFIKKKFGISKAIGKKYLHVIESIPVGAKRSLLLVKIPGKLLVIGMANDQINPLAEITDKAVVDEISPSPDNTNFLGFIKKSYSGEMSGIGSARKK